MSSSRSAGFGPGRVRASGAPLQSSVIERLGSPCPPYTAIGNSLSRTLTSPFDYFTPYSISGTEAAMPDAILHDGNTISFEVRGEGPVVLLPVDPHPVEGPQAEEMARWGADPALGQRIVDGLCGDFRVVAFDYEGHVRAVPKPDTLTPANVAADLLA